MRTAKRRLLWVTGLLVLVAFGYTAGYILSPPTPPAVSRTLPQAPAEAPQQPYAPVETLDET